MEITKEFLEQLEPCQDRWQNYLKHYSDWSGTLREFMGLENITADDKLWVFTQNIPELAKLQQDFAFMCAARAVDGCDVQEVKDYFTLILFIYESGELDLLYSKEYRAADMAAFKAADMAAGWTAHRAAYWAADRAADGATHRAAYWAAGIAAGIDVGWAAHRAAYWAERSGAERAVQVEMIKFLLDRGGKK